MIIRVIVAFRPLPAASKLKDFGFVAQMNKLVGKLGRKFVESWVWEHIVMALLNGATSKKKRIAFFIAVFVVAIFLVCYIFAKPESYRDVANRVCESIFKNDARTLFRYILDEEVNAIDLNVQKLDNLLRLFNSRFEGFELVDETYDFWKEGNELDVIRVYHHKDGRSAWVGIKVVLTDNGVRAACLTQDIARAIATTYFEPNIVNPLGIQLFKQFLQAIQKTMPLYKATGLPGYAKPVKLTGNFKLTTWEEWRDWYAGQIKTIETRDMAHPRQ